MSKEEMQKLEDVDGFFNTVNRGKDPTAAEAAEKVYTDYVEAQKEEKKRIATSPAAPRNDTDDRKIPCANVPDHKAESRYHRRSRARAFWRQVMEPAIGYIALGGVMVAGMVLDMVPSYVALPVSSICWIWAAIRADRFLREV